MCCTNFHIHFLILFVYYYYRYLSRCHIGLSGLMLACVKGHTDVVEYLVDNNADMLIKTSDHMTALGMLFWFLYM